jgi:hypothetical protein
MTKGRTVTDGFGTYGTDVRLMVDFFTGFKIPERDTRDRVQEPELLSLPELDHRPLDHSYQGEKVPFAYTHIQRQIEDERDRQKYRAQIMGEEFILSEPVTEPITNNRRITIDDERDIF